MYVNFGTYLSLPFFAKSVSPISIGGGGGGGGFLVKKNPLMIFLYSCSSSLNLFNVSSDKRQATTRINLVT